MNDGQIKIFTLAQEGALSFHCKLSTFSVDSQSESKISCSQGMILDNHANKLTCGMTLLLCSGSDVKHQVAVPVSYQAESLSPGLNPSQAVWIHS